MDRNKFVDTFLAPRNDKKRTTALASLPQEARLGVLMLVVGVLADREEVAA